MKIEFDEKDKEMMKEGPKVAILPNDDKERLIMLKIRDYNKAIYVIQNMFFDKDFCIENFGFELTGVSLLGVPSESRDRILNEFPKFIEKCMYDPEE